MNKTLLFLIGCLGTRLMLSLFAKNTTPERLQYLGYLALLPAIGFLYIYFNDLRKVGQEAQGVIWWNKLRPVHGVLYLLFAIYAIKKENFAWVALALDTFIGFVVWYLHYYLHFQFV